MISNTVLFEADIHAYAPHLASVADMRQQLTSDGYSLSYQYFTMCGKSSQHSTVASQVIRTRRYLSFQTKINRKEYQS